MNRYASIIFSLLLLVAVEGYAQNTLVDSLVTALHTVKQDTAKLEILDNLADNAPDGEWQKYNEEMGLLAQQLIKNSNARIQYVGKRYYSVYLNNQAYLLAEAGDFRNALRLYNQCLTIYKEINEENGVGLILTNIGAIYDREGDLKNAEINYRKTISLQTKSGNSKDLVASLNNLGVVLFKQQKVDSALFFNLKALGIAEEKKYKDNNVTTLLSNIGDNFKEKGQLEEALRYFEKGLALANEIGDPIGKSSNLKGIANVYFLKSNMAKALPPAKEALTIALQSGGPNSIFKSAEILRKIQERMGNFKDAFQTYQLEIKSRDSLNSKNNQQAVIRHQFQYTYDLKEATAKAEQEKKEAIAQSELKRQKSQKIALIFGLAIMILFAGIFFRQRNKIAREKKLSEALLLNILPAEITDELKERGETTARHFDEVTVLFTDFVEFTQIGSTLSPQVLVQELHECFSAFDEIIERNGLEKIKTVGDAYIAVGGLPVANAHHAQNCVQAAQDILSFMEERKSQEKIFEIRIGLHSGPVVAGIVGVKKFAYDIWGDTVNTAARMEQNSEPGKINISETTYALIKEQFHCLHRGKISAKGKGEIDMYFVENHV